MKYEINCSYNDGEDAYILLSVAIHFNHTLDKNQHWVTNEIVEELHRKILIKF